MKRCGRPRKNFKAATTTQVIQYPESGLPQSAPIISSLVESGQFNLLDLPRLQAELEHLLASATERMVCLSSELNGTALPPSILRHLGLLEAEDSNHPYPTQAPSSLVVTANPNKPLSLIISSQRRQAADAQLQEAGVAANENPVSVPAVPQSSSPSAAERTANPAHDVPNRFWALMEPYCADITETNISYLESILKSYVEEATTAKYFQLPPEANTAVAAATDHNLRSAHHSPDHHLAHIPKRLRRDCQKTSQLHGDSEAQEHSELSGALKAATEMVQLARCIDAQLKQPSLSLTTSSEATALEDLVHSIENELYQENVSSVLCSAVTHMAKGDFCPGSPVQANCVQNHLTNDRKSPCLLDAFGPPSPSKLNGGGLPHFPYRVCDSLTSLTTQPLKNLARQLQVSSSFRVEKKVAQAMEELGLFPLTLYLNHLAQRPSSPLLPAHLPPPSTPRWRNAVPPPPPPPSSRGGNSTTADFKREPPTSPPPVNSREPSQCGLAPMDSKSTHPAGEECVTASEHPHHVNGSMAPKSLQTLEKSRSLSTSTTAQPCTRNARRNSHNSSALKGSKSQSESPLLNGFASSENGDEGRDKEAEGEEKVDEKYSECVENGETEKNGVDETEEEEAEVSADMKDADSCDTHGSPDAQDEEAAVEVAEDGGRPSTAVSRCLTEDFEAAESENPQCSPQHRASLRGPTTACNTTTSSSSTISKRVCNTKKWLTSIPTKQAPGASEPADNASSRGSASAKAGARGSEKSGAFADLFNSALDMVAGGQQNQPSAGRCEGLEELVATAPTDDDDLSGCLLNLAAAATSAAATAAAEQTGGSDLSTLVPSGSNSDVTLALLQRQRELRLVCAANHSVLHRLIQAARRDLQRQEIQRRLAIADADVIEAYNKLEGYRLHHRPALKRDRDAAWKTLKERQKIRAELEAFDRKGP